jgi:hypothetical protein
MIVVFKVDDKQCIKVIPDPDFSFYVAKPDVNITYNLDNIERTKVDEVTIKYHDLEKVLADYSGKKDAYYDLKSGRARYSSFDEKMSAMKHFRDTLQLNPRVFGSDIHIEDYYKHKFIDQYGVNIGGYKRMFYDIETDGASDPHEARAPINCMSFYDAFSDTMYTYIWDQPTRWPTFNKFKASILSGEFEQELRNDPEMNGQFEQELIAQGVRGIDGGFTNKNTKYVIEFFEDELDMLLKRYEMIHKLKPDFCLAWNFSFDELTSIGRLKYNLERKHSTAKIEDIICHPDIPPEYRRWFFREDVNPQHEYYNKWHILSIPGYTQYICAMATYANVRKGAGSQMSYNLNDVCMLNLRKGKLDYHGIASDPMELPYKDFTMHIHYNIRDVWTMAHLEHKNNDIDQLMYLVELTKLSDAAKKTAIVKNKQQQFYEQNGLVMGNNINALIQNPQTDYKGAIVAQPDLNEPIVTPLFPYPSKMIRPFLIDNDLASMYPNAAIGSNIYKTSLLFEIKNIGEASPMHPEVPAIDKEECFDNLQTGHIEAWCHDYLQLPSITELVTELDKDLHRLYKEKTGE